MTERYKDDDDDDDDDALCFYCEERQTGRRMIMSRAFRRMPAVDLRRVQTGKQGKTALCLIHVASYTHNVYVSESYFFNVKSLVVSVTTGRKVKC